MRKIVTAAGAFLGLAVACAGTARAECRPSEFCLDGACRTVVACGNVEPTSTAPAGGTVSKAALPGAAAPAPQPTKSAPRNGPPTPADPALQPAAAHPAPAARTTTQDLREQLHGMTNGRRRR